MFGEGTPLLGGEVTACAHMGEVAACAEGGWEVQAGAERAAVLAVCVEFRRGGRVCGGQGG